MINLVSIIINDCYYKKENTLLNASNLYLLQKESGSIVYLLSHLYKQEFEKLNALIFKIY